MLDRRGFLKFVGGAAVGTLATPVVWKGLDDLSIWTQNWPWIPRLDKGNNLNTYITTTSKLCPSASGMRVRLVNGRPVRVLGDVNNPLSRGGVSALASAEVQLRYSPARLKRPLRKTSDGTYVAISWSEAETVLRAELAKAAKDGGLLCLSGDENGTMNELLSALTVATGSSDFYLMPGEAQTTAAAWKSLGGKGRVGYDFARSDYVLAVGAGVLENWGPVVGNRRAWGQARPQDGEPAMRLAYAGPVQNNTAAGADLWLPIRPGTEMAFLLGIAQILFARGCQSAGVESFVQLASEWTPDKVAAVTGLAPERLQMAVEQLLSAKAPLIIVGTDLAQGGEAVPVILGIALNTLLDRINQDGGLRVLPVAEPVFSRAMSYGDMMAQDFTAAVRAVAEKKRPAPSMVMIYEANPVYAMPGGAGVEALLQNAGFTVSFSCFFDETAKQCDLILPAAMGLERLDDVSTPFGFGESFYTLCRPVAKPLYEARAAGDVLLGVARQIGLDLGYASYKDALEAKAARLGIDWGKLMEGACITSRVTLPLQSLIFPSEQIATALQGRLAQPEKGTLAVATLTKLAFGTADSAIPPFCTKLVTDAELTAGELSASMNSATIRSLGLSEGMKVRLVAGEASLPARVRAFEGVAMGTVALATGFGHANFDAFNNGKGSNVMDLFTAVEEPGTGLAVWRCPDVKIVKA
ncbi:MAG TPA: molybdopterin-dependent oxidoreductase [Candidatus Avidesulfovibrio excrementigallinarum]|nr:molybdopterin-dependent oxidoreductase [Candidatus Avidesulfovibrio excrementigallinarum]